jgi:hypothetical protein
MRAAQPARPQLAERLPTLYSATLSPLLYLVIPHPSPISCHLRALVHPESLSLILSSQAYELETSPLYLATNLMLFLSTVFLFVYHLSKLRRASIAENAEADTERVLQNNLMASQRFIFCNLVQVHTHKFCRFPRPFKLLFSSGC